MGKKKLSRLKTVSYDETRRKILLEDNEKEDKIIRQLAKKLRIPKKFKRSNQKSQHPTWMKQYGLDYILDFEEELNTDIQKGPTPEVIGVPSKKKKTQKDIYGQEKNYFAQDVTPSEDSATDDIFVEDRCRGNSLPLESTNNVVNKISHNEETIDPPTDQNQLRKSIRSWLNKVSESQMHHVVAELTNLFLNHPRAYVRSVLIEELHSLLESSPVGDRSNAGWLQQDMAVCMTCVHVSLHSKLQHDNIISYVVEDIVDNLFDRSGSFQKPTGYISFCLFLAYLYRFDVVSPRLLFDTMQRLLDEGSLAALKTVHVMCTAVGVNLRKSDFKTCQDVIQKATKMLTQCTSDQIEKICELEGIIQRLSEKHSKNEIVSRAMHLKKMMRTWTRVQSIPDNLCLGIGLSDILHRETTGRWWIVGIAGNQSTGPSADLVIDPVVKDINSFPPEVEAAALRLGLRTETRKLLFHTLVSTPGGPDATATALIRVCGGANVKNHAESASKEREMVQIVLHCLMAENPFNRFYPRVLGGLLNYHRRFLMMIKCAFWDVMKKVELSTAAKANAGQAIGLLSLVYDLPLTVLKNFNFGDSSDGNVALLKNVFAELCAGDYQTALSKLMQLSCYTHLSRNCRIFMRKHFSQDPDNRVKTCILRLMNDMREYEQS